MSSFMQNDRLNDYINSHPRECLWVVLVVVCFVWQSVVAILALSIYLILIKRFQVKWWWLFLTGGVLFGGALLLSQQDFSSIIKQGFNNNAAFWHCLLRSSPLEAISTVKFNYIVGFPLVLAGLFSLIDLIPKNPHRQEMLALQKGQYNVMSELSEEQAAKALAKINDDDHDGTVLGVSKYTGKTVVINDQDINQVLLVLGTTGSGKTITLRRFYQRAIKKGYPLIIVDGKPDESNIAWIMSLAEKHRRKFFGFNCGNYLPYDPLANGGYTELKDKIISLKDEWSSDHYRSIAEDYLQAVFEVLLRSKKPFNLKTVVRYLNYTDLLVLTRSVNDLELIKRVETLEQYNRDDITGLQAHLNILIHSELGKFFEINDLTFNLSQVIEENGVVYFSLPALRFPSFSKVLGKLVINDLKTVIDRNYNKRIFCVFDEFSVFAGEQVLNLVNMGRGKGVHAIFGTQGLSDLGKIDDTFKNQVMNCVNTLICHRLNDHESAESVSGWVGTKDAFTVTAQLDTQQSDSGLGSVRLNKEFIIHPDQIKQWLFAGEAFYVTKVGRFGCEKTKIKS
jgi:conjugal transfer pilus assembly protein TraD